MSSVAGSMTPKFAFVSSVLPPAWSGQAIVIGRLLAGLPADGYCIASLNDYIGIPDLPQFTDRLPGRYYHLPEEPQLTRGAGLAVVAWANLWLHIWARGRNIARILRQEHSQVAVAATGDLIDLPATWLACRMATASFLPYYFDDYVFQWAEADLRRQARWLEGLMFRGLKAVIVPNEFMAQEIHRRWGVTATIVRNPCQELGLDGAPDAVPATDNSAIVYTGAVYHANLAALQSLLTAMREPDLGDLRLHLYTAHAPEWLRQKGLDGKTVVCHAHVPPSEVGRVQRAGRVLFMPFAFNSGIPEVIRTSAPSKLSDYLASGVPILADAPADTFVSWYLREHDCGLVVERDTSDALADGLRQLISDPELGHRLGQNARARAQAEFTPEESRRRFVRVLERLA
jgi:glycosyltransferase involved in cell wall biosynthesis